MAHESSISFITGGVRSGKSSFAERMAMELAQSFNDSQLQYVAAMQPSDVEMKQRIRRHKEVRVQSGYNWKTREKPILIGELARTFKSNDIVLLDCLTTWLNNELFIVEDKWQDEQFQADLFEQMCQGIHAISLKVKALIIVSNEVFYESIQQNELVLIYSKLLGKLHQYIVTTAKQAFLVEAGIPILMKGEVQ